MTNDQALLLASMLIDAVRKAVANGSDTVDVITGLQAADDAEREALERAMEDVEALLANARG